MKKKSKKMITVQAGALQVTRQKIYKKGTSTLARIGLDELAELLRTGGPHAAQVEELRKDLAHWRGLGIDHTWNMTVERIRPAALLQQRGGNWVLLSCSGIVMLKLENVFTAEEREAVLRVAQAVPTTLMAFVGASGMSMYLLVRVSAKDGGVGTTVEEAEAFHQTAFRQVATFYNALLPKRVHRQLGCRLSDDFMLSLDPKRFYRADAVPFEVNPEMELPAQPRVERDFELEELLLPVPTMSDYREYYDERWQMAIDVAEKAFEQEGRDLSVEDERGFMPTLVAACFKLGIPLAETRARLIARMLVPRAEAEACVNGYYEKHDPSAIESKATQDVAGMERWLQKNYEFQRNAITRECAYRPRTTRGLWQQVGPAEQATFTLEAMKAGLRVNRGNIRDYVTSNLIPLRDPVHDFLHHCQQVGWDGRDRVEALAACVPTGYDAWPRMFHIFMCAMVWQMQGGDGRHGNALMPLLIGEQGTGKSTFCRALLPPDLRWGWLEKLDFTDLTKVERLMGKTLLIDLDEFNQLGDRLQRGALKNLLQLPDVRVSTRGVFEVLPRRASFIGTCNPAEVLADETGSRRYICVKVRQGRRIQLPVDLDYVQLYAQIVWELGEREEHPEAFDAADPRGRTYLTPEEEHALIEHNRSYERPRLLVELFDSMYEPLPDRKDYRVRDNTVEMTRAELVTHIEKVARQHFPEHEKRALATHLDALVDAGRVAKYHTRKGNSYHLRPLRTMA